VTTYGYGTLDTIPAVYGLACVTPEVLEVSFGTPTGFYREFALLWQRIADDLAASGTSIEYGVDTQDEAEAWRHQQQYHVSETATTWLDSSTDT
jgi:hypothetical protein